MVSDVCVSATYPSLKEGARLPSKRSDYCHLEPIGIGTSYVESLTSYISRLATAHCVSVGTLYEFAILPALNKPYLVARPYHGPAAGLIGSFRNQLKSINGTGKTAQEWAELLERMTLWPGLMYLTLLPWSEVLTCSELLRHNQAWCPACYDEMLTTDGIVYQPLIWSVALMHVCIRHRIRLVDRCPKCNRQFHALARRMKSGFCARCYRWLGSTANELERKSEVAGKELEWQEFISDNVGKLLGTTCHKQSKPSKSNIAKWLRIYNDRITGNKVSFLATVLRKPTPTVHSWFYNSVRPNLSNLLRICYCMDIQLIDLLMGNVIKENKVFQIRHFPSELSPVEPSRKHKHFNRTKVKKQLGKYLKHSPPVSLVTVSIKLGVDRSTLRKHFPEVCRTLSGKFKEYLQDRYRKHQAQRAEEVRRACFELYKQGVYLSAGSVTKFLDKRSYMGRRDVCAIIFATRKELGQTRK